MTHHTRQVSVQRFSLTTSKPFKDVVAGIEARVGHPDMIAFRKNMTAAETDVALQKIVQAATGSSGLMEFTRFDLGEVLRKELGSKAAQSLRLVVGNPLIMRQMEVSSGRRLLCSGDDSDRRAAKRSAHLLR
jgi:hypothetical protein